MLSFLPIIPYLDLDHIFWSLFPKHPVNLSFYTFYGCLTEENFLHPCEIKKKKRKSFFTRSLASLPHIPQSLNHGMWKLHDACSKIDPTSNFTDFSGFLFHNTGKTYSNQDDPNFILTPENRGSTIEKLKYPWAETLFYRFKTSAWESIVRSINDVFKTTTKPIENEIC